MVYGTYNELVTRAFVNQRSHHWGASHCKAITSPLGESPDVCCRMSLAQLRSGSEIVKCPMLCWWNHYGFLLVSYGFLWFPIGFLLVFYWFPMVSTLWSTFTSLWKDPPIFHGKIHYFYGLTSFSPSIQPLGQAAIVAPQDQPQTPPTELHRAPTRSMVLGHGDPHVVKTWCVVGLTPLTIGTMWGPPVMFVG